MVPINGFFSRTVSKNIENGRVYELLSAKIGYWHRPISGEVVLYGRES